MFELKSKNPALRGGDDQATTQILQTSAPDQVLAYLRKNGNDEVLVILNLSDAQHLKVQILDETVKGKFKSIFSGLTTDFDAKPTIEMYKWEHIVFEKLTIGKLIKRLTLVPFLKQKGFVVFI